MSTALREGVIEVADNLLTGARSGFPVIQAPMAGGATTSDLVVAACEEGALGFIAGAYQSAAQLERQAAEVRARTNRPFGVNMFAPVSAEKAPADTEAALRLVAAYHERLGLPAPELGAGFDEDLETRVQAALQSGASVLSFTFGVMPEWVLAAAKERGMAVVGTATTVEEAVTLERWGVDAVVAQGSEAGGHRGTFAGDFGDALVGTMALVPQVVDAVDVPVIASGGITDGRGVAAAFALGAAAVQLGTAFLTTEESGLPEAHKNALLTGGRATRATRVTRAYSGRPARGLVNEFLLEAEATPGAILPFPYQNHLTRALRQGAVRAGDAEALSLWAGQAYPLARRESVAELLARLDSEAREAAAALQGRVK